MRLLSREAISYVKATIISKTPESHTVWIRETRELSPQDYLRLLEPDGFDLLNCIATKESKWRNVPNYLYDSEDGIYTAFGPFQILKSTAAKYSNDDRRDAYTNVRIAVKIFRNEGVLPWLVWPQCMNYLMR